MAKKIEESDVKKECPSCGLGVALDSRICEFCGWDFQEEDEWILQIEKLERDLLTEKQKFEPGSVDQRIEATLHVPVPRRTQSSAKGDETAPSEQRQAADAQASSQAVDAGPGTASETGSVRDARARTIKTAAEAEPLPKKAPVVRQVKAAKKAPEPQPEPESPREAGDQTKTRKVRVVRKVKK